MSAEEEVPLKQRIAKFKEDCKNIDVLSEQIFSSPNNKFVQGSDTYTKTDLRKFRSNLLKEFDALITLASKSSGKKKSKSKKTNESKKNNPMFAPKYVSSGFVEYFKGIDLGNAYVKHEDGTFTELGELKSQLPLFFNKNITSCASLTPLFVIVTKLRKLQYKDNAQYIVPDERFKKFFGKIFETLLKEQEEGIKQLESDLKSAAGEEKNELNKQLKKLLDKKINPERIRLVRFQTVVSKCTKKELSEEEKNLLCDEKTIKAIANEQKIISDTLAFYRGDSESKEE